jgi:hypothetical protein
MAAKPLLATVLSDVNTIRNRFVTDVIDHVASRSQNVPCSRTERLSSPTLVTAIAS